MGNVGEGREKKWMIKQNEYENITFNKNGIEHHLNEIKFNNNINLLFTMFFTLFTTRTTF